MFLGFGFHPQNMTLINPGIQGNAKRIFATAKGISDSDSPIIEKQIKDLVDTKPQVNLRRDLICADLFNQFRRSLSPS